METVNELLYDKEIQTAIWEHFDLPKECVFPNFGDLRPTLCGKIHAAAVTFDDAIHVESEERSRINLFISFIQLDSELSKCENEIATKEGSDYMHYRKPGWLRQQLRYFFLTD